MSTLESFEYVDRNYNGKIVQVGMFERITNKNAEPASIEKAD